MFSRSSASLILEVAWRSKARRASSRTMPHPLSITWISFLPPASTCTLTRWVPASSEFSSSSFSTDAGRSTTSPAAILLATCSESTWIRPMAPLILAGHKNNHKEDARNVNHRGTESSEEGRGYKSRCTLCVPLWLKGLFRRTQGRRRVLRKFLQHSVGPLDIELSKGQ